MKRIFKNFFLIFFFYFFGFVFLIAQPVYSSAEEDDEDIEWLDEEDEGEVVDSDEQTDSNEKTDENKSEDTATAEEPSDETNQEDSAGTADESVDDTDVGSADDTETASESNLFADEYEKNLYETYIQYYSKKVTTADWNSVSSNKDTYVIQPKDTLWDISQVLFGDPNYWPKLWSVNPSLTNPHLIQPNSTLGFIHGTEDQAPSLQVIPGLSSGSKKDSSPPPLPDYLKGKKIAVPAQEGIKPVLKNIPDSLPPLYLSNKRSDKFIDLDIAFKKVPTPMVSFLHYYMSSNPVSAQGTVSDKKEYGSVFHVSQRVILEMREPPNPGQKLMVVRDMGKLYPSIFGVRGPFGYQVEVQGEVEVIGRVPDSFDLYEAKVTKSLNPISIGSLVLNSNLIQFDYQSTDLAGNSEAQIIGVPGPKSHAKNVASPYSLVYLNRGMGSGFSVGQMYQIKSNPNIERKQEYGYDIKLGEVKIIYADDRFATGLITQMNNPIHVGDYLVSLSQGLSMQEGYDPFGEVEDADMEPVSPGEGSGAAPADDADMDFDDFEDAGDSFEDAPGGQGSPSAPEEDDPYGDEDTFEAFE